MANNKIIRIGPVALTTTLTTNIVNPNVTSLAGPVGFTMTQPYLILTRIAITNKTASAATFSLWVGASAGNVAGTEEFNGVVVPANTTLYFPCRLRLDSGDFLVGGSNTATALTLQADAEIGLS